MLSVRDRSALRYLLAICLGTSVLGMPAPGHAQSQPKVTDERLAELLDRIERLERDRQTLEDRLQMIEDSDESDDEEQIPERPAASKKTLSPVSAQAPTHPDELPTLELTERADAALSDQVDSQGQQISRLESALHKLQGKATEKKFPNITINGVFQADSAWTHQDATSRDQFGPIEDGGGFRRARLSAKGSVTPNVNYMFQTDVGTAGIGRPTITDMWVETTDVPFFGNVRVGQWKQPFSLEVVSSFRYTTFMERSSLFQPFTAFRRLGIGFYDHSEDLSMTWAVSGFHSGQDQYGATYTNDGGYGTAERVTFLPYWENDGKDYLHIGFGHFFNAPANDTTVFRSIPELFIGAQGNGVVGSSGQPVPGALNGTPFFVNTGNINVNAYNVLGSELLWVRGPVSFQSEAMLNIVDQAGNNPVAFLPGMYAQVGYFLTGEHRPYDRKAGAIDRVIPFRNVRFCGDNGNGYGWGAWEVAGRFSYLDLTDENIRGGTLTDTTVGVNWYLNPFFKCAFNWVHAIAESDAYPNSHTNMFATRAQIDF